MCLSKYFDEFGILGSLHVRHSREMRGTTSVFELLVLFPLYYLFECWCNSMLLDCKTVGCMRNKNKNTLHSSHIYAKNDYWMRFSDGQDDQGLGRWCKCYQPKAEADNTYQDLDYCG